jgi:5-methylcytosine-specific restriction endonuclease McrA
MPSGIYERKHPINCVCMICKAVRGEYNDENNPMFGKHHSLKSIELMKNNLDFKNLIALCRSCNSKVNYNREYWFEFFQLK